MEKNFMPSDSIMELEFITEREKNTHTHEEFELLYLLNGSVCVNVEDEEFNLNPRDMLIVNPDKKHSYRGDSDVFLAKFMISYTKLAQLLEQEVILFWCNSVIDRNEAYDELREIITQIFNQYNSNDARGHIYLKSLYYQLLHVLTSNFLLTSSDIRFQAEKDRADDRMQEIMRYLRANFRQNISLQDLADKMYLSTAYLSKYIKKNCGITYMDLINSVRLDRSMEELVYTDTAVMKVAMDCGFASVAAYNKVFKEKYDCTPSEFRKRIREEQTKEQKEETEKRQKLIRQKVQAYLEEKQEKCKKDKSGNTVEIQVSVNKAEPAASEWNDRENKLINIGTAANLGRASFRRQILFLKEHLGIQYVRFWDIYAPEMYLDIHAGRGNYHFGRLDEAVDFLVKNELKPYVELGFKPMRLLKNTREALLEISREQEFESEDEMQCFFTEFIKHFVKRYGPEEVQTWYFEYWKKEELKFDAEMSFSYTPMSSVSQQVYFHKFDIIASCFRSVLPDVKIGGGGFSLQHYKAEGFRNILKWWKQAECQPDFLSFNCYPYQMQNDDGIFFEKKSTDMFFVKHNLELAREIVKEENFPETELHVSEYSLTLSNRNAVNDSCAKGAFLVQNAFACYGKADLTGYWLGFDGYADFSDAKQFLFGGCGLLTKTGVTKPAFYAFEFLNYLHGRIYSMDKTHVCTGNGRDSFRIVCHNFTGFNYNYYLTDEDKIRIQNIPVMLNENREMLYRVRLEGVSNGSYIIKSRQINQQYGSVQDEWFRLNLEKELNMQEMEYLERISIPRLQIRHQEVCRNVLEFEYTLAPNEIRSLHIIYAGNEIQD